jgi:hypothetical protein
MGDDAKSVADSLRELAATVNNLATKLDDPTVGVDRLAPLAPVASKLAALPEKVTALQSSALDNTEQVKALNLALYRVESAQRDCKAHVAEDGDDSGETGKAPPKPPPKSGATGEQPPFHHEPPPRNPYREEEDDYTDTRFHPRARLEFPTFDGKEDPLSWLNRCETFFRGQNTPERRRVWYAAMHLTGSAQLWYSRLELTAGTPSWRRFTQLVQQRFRPPMTDSPVGQIMLLRRDGSVEEYTDKFLALACHDADLTELQLIQMYTAGLVNPLKTDVALRRPQSLDDAIMLAHAYEQRMLLAPSDTGQGRGGRLAFSSGPPASAAKTVSTASAPASSSASTAGTGKVTPLSASLPRRRLSPAEMSQRRADGLCYNCDEKFVLGHRCKKLFILEVVVDDEEEVTEEAECAALSGVLDAPAISLHAITSVRAKGFQTMKVFVSVGDAVAVALLDSGSSHNFIDTDMARRAGIPFSARPGLSVAVANRERLTSPGYALSHPFSEENRMHLIRVP